MLFAKQDTKLILKDKMVVANFSKITIINDLGSFYKNLKRYGFEKFKIECNRIPFKDRVGS